MSRSRVDEKIKKLYKTEIETIRVRSYRAMKMEYHQASLYDISLERLEFVLFVLIFVGVAVGYYESVVGGTLLATPGVIVTLFDTFNKLFSVYKSQDFVPIMRARAVTHNNAGANWQWLQQKAESHLIMLNKPGIPLKTVQIWHSELFDKRKEICANVIVQEDVYKSFNEQKTFLESNLAYNQTNKFLKEMLHSLEIGAEPPSNIECDQKEANCSKPFYKCLLKMVHKMYKCVCNWFYFSLWICNVLIYFLLLLAVYKIAWYCVNRIL
ncbi:unnamed protein product [Lymnaea stagnalis]|uniref:Uncharacterized protein n=1 Tax=Lymnaea stagnalis TaxID=6523 RepID=A0AAV2HDQ1_LYMST